MPFVFIWGFQQWKGKNEYFAIMLVYKDRRTLEGTFILIPSFSEESFVPLLWNDK